jgi:hypothetical protein
MARKLEVFGMFNRDIETNEVVNDFGEVVGHIVDGKFIEINTLWDGAK